MHLFCAQRGAGVVLNTLSKFLRNSGATAATRIVSTVDTAATTWIVAPSRRRRGCHVDRPRDRRVDYPEGRLPRRSISGHNEARDVGEADPKDYDSDDEDLPIIEEIDEYVRRADLFL